MTFSDVLTSILVTADYPKQKRASFVNTFYEYLFVKLLSEIENTEPTLYQKLMEYFENPEAKNQQIAEGLQEAYQNPELKEKMDKVIEEVTGELADDVAKFASVDQKQKILASLPQG